MTASEIRALHRHTLSSLTEAHLSTEGQQLYWLAASSRALSEIAAQLAELNQTLRKEADRAAQAKD